MTEKEWRSVFRMERRVEEATGDVTLELDIDGNAEGTNINYIALDGLLELNMALILHRLGWQKPEDCDLDVFLEAFEADVRSWSYWQLMMTEYEKESGEHPLKLAVLAIPTHADGEKEERFTYLLPSSVTISFENILDIGYRHATLSGSVAAVEKTTNMVIAYLIKETFTSSEAFIQRYLDRLVRTWNDLPGDSRQFDQYIQPWLDAIESITE